MTAPDTAKKTWTILELVNWGTAYLADKGFDDARLTIELLLAHILHLQRIQLYTSFDRPLSGGELAHFKELLKRRLSHEPLQYILSETEFMGLKFTVDSRALIPRSDTEVLVDAVIQKVKNTFAAENEVRVLDIGTGSGCIAVSLATLLHNVALTAIDVSNDAIELASSNAEKNGVVGKIIFLQRNFLTDHVGDKKFHCIVSNPPYISNEEYAQLPPEVKEFEPRLALADGGNGLAFFKEIALCAAQTLVPGGFVAVEHAFDQSESVQHIFQEAELTNVSAIKDFDGHFRCVVAEKYIQEEK